MRGLKYSATLEKFLKSNKGNHIWVLLKDSGESILGKLVEYGENIIVLNIVEKRNDSMEVTDVLLLFDLDSVFGFTAGEESFNVFKRAIEETKLAHEAKRKRMDEREIA